MPFTAAFALSLSLPLWLSSWETMYEFFNMDSFAKQNGLSSVLCILACRVEYMKFKRHKQKETEVMQHVI